MLKGALIATSIGISDIGLFFNIGNNDKNLTDTNIILVSEFLPLLLI